MSADTSPIYQLWFARLGGSGFYHITTEYPAGTDVDRLWDDDPLYIGHNVVGDTPSIPPVVLEWQRAQHTMGWPRLGTCPTCHTETVLRYQGLQEDGDGGLFSLWLCSYCKSCVSGQRFLPADEEARIVAKEAPRGLRILEAVG